MPSTLLLSKHVDVTRRLPTHEQPTTSHQLHAPSQSMEMHLRLHFPDHSSCSLFTNSTLPLQYSYPSLLTSTPTLPNHTNTSAHFSSSLPAPQLPCPLPALSILQYSTTSPIYRPTQHPVMTQPTFSNFHKSPIVPPSSLIPPT
jgi:hypothetical protein